MLIKDEKHPRAPFQVLIIEFGCANCGRRWRSAGGSLTDFQICKGCYEKCYPGRYKMQAPNKKGNQNRETFIPHDSELCGKCIRLGYSCMEQGVEEESSIIVSNEDGEELRLGNRNLSSFFEIKPAKKVNKKKKKDASATANMEKPQMKKIVDESTRMFFKNTETVTKNVIVIDNAKTMEDFSKHIENLEIRDKNDLMMKQIEVDKTVVNEETEQTKENDHEETVQTKENDHEESEPANLNNVNDDDSMDPGATEDTLTNVDQGEKAKTVQNDKENGSCTSEVYGEKIDNSTDNIETYEKALFDHAEEEESLKHVQLEELK